MGAVNARRNAQPSVAKIDWNTEVRQVKLHVLFAQPVLFSKSVNASLVDTLLPPAATSSATIAATLVPTAETLPRGTEGMQKQKFTIYYHIK